MIDTKRLRTLADRDRATTHWVGCEYDHIGCAIVAACREIEALRAAKQNPCYWRVAPNDRPERGGVIWSTECRRQFELLDGRPSDYEMKWCPFCGGELVHDKLVGMED